MSEACQNVQRAVSTKTSIPAIEGIYIKALGDEVILTGYDLELGITTSVKANVEENGGTILNARVLCDILRKLPGQYVRIEADERQLAVISSQKAEYSLIGISPREFPELPSVTGGFPIVIEQDLLKEMIRQTIFAVAVNDSKVVHTGIKFEIKENEIKLIAVDGFRLAIRKEPISYTGDEITFVVPSKTLSEIVKLFNGSSKTVSMAVGKRHLVFEIDNEELSYKATFRDFCRIIGNSAILISEI
ncbi:MAG: DNA polymerase III subunit beta, partial [Clostridiales bacterium]|nr:DNA polymerase III subunit beta [Clostridiales bacterium]